MRGLRFSWMILCALWIFGAAAGGDAVAQDRRVALVVGVDQYQDPGIHGLPAAATDAKLIGDALARHGFEVMSVRNPDRAGLLTALGQFSTRSQTAAVSLFYFAGHGIEFESRNLLLPADMPRSPENSVIARGRAVTLDEVLGAMRGAAKVVILDACRDNPLRFADTATRSLTASSGLVEQRAEGFLTIYSAGRGQQALDGLFTRVLMEEAQKPNIDFRTAVINARQRVIEEAKAKNHVQRPAYYDEMDGAFSLLRVAGAPTALTPASPPSVAAIPSAAPPPPPPPAAIVAAPPPPAAGSSLGSGFGSTFSSLGAAPPPQAIQPAPSLSAPINPATRRRPPPGALGVEDDDVPTRTSAATSKQNDPAGGGGVAICQLGGRVFALSDGAWYAGRVLRAGSQGCKIRFDGFGPDDDEEVPSSKLLPWSAEGPGRAVASCQVGDKVIAFSDQGWFPGKILAVDPHGCTIRYKGYDADSDEQLPLSMIRKL